MVLSIFTDTTTPSFTLRRLGRGAFCSSAISSTMRCPLALVGLGGSDLALAKQGLDPGDVAPHLGNARQVVELTGRVLEAEVEQLLLRLPQPVLELGVVQFTQFLGLFGHRRVPYPSSWRTTKRVLIGSLCIARRIASRAVGSGTPESSNITRPGFTTATQCSGLPLPEPMRVSAGFWVTGLSGKMLIQTFPPRL